MWPSMYPLIRSKKEPTYRLLPYLASPSGRRNRVDGKMDSPPITIPTATRNRMTANRRRDTQPELRLRSALHRMGLRFRVDTSPIEGSRRRADIVFTRAKVAVFVDGCFWHGCPLHGTRSKTNTAFGDEKIKANQARDRDTDGQLSAIGWIPIRIWEHESNDVAAVRVARTVRSRSSQNGQCPE